MVLFAVESRVGYRNLSGGGGDSFTLAPECLTSYEALARSVAREGGGTVVAFELREVKRYMVVEGSALPQLRLQT